MAQGKPLCVIYFGRNNIWKHQVHGKPVAQYTLERLRAVFPENPLWGVYCEADCKKSEITYEGIDRVYSETILLPKIIAESSESFILVRAEDVFICPDLIKKLYQVHEEKGKAISVARDWPQTLSGTIVKKSIFEKLSPKSLITSCFNLRRFPIRPGYVSALELEEKREGTYGCSPSMINETSVRAFEWVVGSRKADFEGLTQKAIATHVLPEFYSILSIARMIRQNTKSISVLDTVSAPQIHRIAGLMCCLVPEVHLTLVSQYHVTDKQTLALFNHVKTPFVTVSHQNGSGNSLFTKRADVCIAPFCSDENYDRTKETTLVRFLRPHRILHLGERLEMQILCPCWLSHVWSEIRVILHMVESTATFLLNKAAQFFNFLTRRNRSSEKADRIHP